MEDIYELVDLIFFMMFHKLIYPFFHWLRQSFFFFFAFMLISLNYTVALISLVLIFVKRTQLSQLVLFVGHKSKEWAKEIWTWHPFALSFILSSPVQVLHHSLLWRSNMINHFCHYALLNESFFLLLIKF